MNISHGSPEVIARSLDALVRADLQTLRDSYFRWLLIFAGVVVLGVVLEGPEVVHETLEIFRCLRKRAQRWIGFLALLGWILVALGVAGEVVAEALVARSEELLQEFNDILLTEATKQAGNAKNSADASANAAQRAKDESDKARQSASDALALAQGARHALRIQGPRWRLLEDGKVTFIKALTPYAGQRVTVMSCGLMSAPEPFKLEQDLLNFLGKQGAGWAVESPGYTHWKSCSNGASGVGGNLVIVNSNGGEIVKVAANALSDALNQLEISTINTQAPPLPEGPAVEFLGPGSPWDLAAKDPTAVFLLVGTNPMFDLAGWNKRHK